jgi:hypothetical protein
MRSRVAAWAVVLWLGLQTGPPGPKLVGVWYAGPGARAPMIALEDPEAVGRDLTLIRRAWFNALSTWISWAEAEQQRGSIQIAGTERLIAAAAGEDLQVTIHILTDQVPAWARGDSAASARFTEAIRARLTGARGVRATHVGRPTGEESPIEIASDGSNLARARLAFWRAIARGAQTITFSQAGGGIGRGLLGLGETAGVVTRNERLFERLRARERGVREVSGGGGAPVDVRLLESADVVMVIGLNATPVPQKVRIAFDPDIPEAIWQNLETGATVNFVMTKSGPVLEHTFAPHDALVLMTGKKLR